MITTCSKDGCKSLGTHWVSIDLYPPSSTGYEGKPAQLLFYDLPFCEEHAKELKWNDLIYPEQIVGVFQGLGRVAPDFSKTQVHAQVMPGAETV